MRMTSVLFFSFALAVPVYAADYRPLDSAALQALADKAEHAGQKEQAYLYAQLVRGSTEIAGTSLAKGDTQTGNHALSSVIAYAEALDAAVAHDAKKLKDAEILLRESAFRMKAAMLATSLEDRPAMAAALSRIDAVESRLMGAVFSK